MHYLLKKASPFAIMAFMSVTPVYATDPIIFENINNAQVNLTDVTSQVNLDLDIVGIQSKIEGTAFGNNFVTSAEGAGALNVNTNQRSETDNIISRVNIDVEETPILDIHSEALANKAVVINKNETGHNTINNTQFAAEAPPPPPPPRRIFVGGLRNGDPLSDVDVVAGSLDDLHLDSTAGGNLGQFVLAGHGNTVNSTQTTDIMNNSLVDMTIGNISNELDIKSEAWGNSLVLVLGDIPQDEVDN